MSPTSAIEWHDLIGKPFKAGGFGPDGYDCRGLAVEVLKRKGINLPDGMADVERDALEGNESRMRLHERITEELPKWERVDRPEPGDLVAIMIRPPYVNHLGVIIEHGRFIHILDKTRVVTARLDDITWKKRIAGFYRWPGGNGGK